MSERASTAYETLGRIAFATMTLLMLSGLAAVAFYTFAPMSAWVDYRGFEVLPPDAEGKQFVKIDRTVRKWVKVIPVRRYVEVHVAVPSGTVQACQYDINAIAENSPKPYTLIELGEFAPTCDWKKFEGRRLTIQVAWTLLRPLTIYKVTSLESMSMVVRDGVLVAAEGGAAGTTLAPSRVIKGISPTSF